MARAYLTEKQMPKDYWFHAIHHAARMHNQIPITFNGKLTTPFELVHRVAPDSRTWFPLFSIVYFYKETDADKDRENFQAKAMIGIAVGRSTKTNALSVYHPITKKYYERTRTSSIPPASRATSSPTRSATMVVSLSISTNTPTGTFPSPTHRGFPS